MKNILKKLKEKVSKKTIQYIIISLLSFYSINEIKDMIKSDIEINDDNKKEFLNELEKHKGKANTNIKALTLKNNLPINIKDTLNDNKYKNITELKLSQKGWDMIRNEEKLKLKAYKLGDGMITIGYGHAERISNSKYKIGDKITKKEALKLFHKDVNNAASGIRRLWKRWKNKGIDIKLTQNQYDALVSLTYNIGVNGLLKSKFIQELKKGNYNKAAKLLKTCKIGKFSGVKIRRLREYKLFIS